MKHLEVFLWFFLKIVFLMSVYTKDKEIQTSVAIILKHFLFHY